MGVRKRQHKWWVDFSFNRARYRRPSPENSRAGALAYELVLKQKLARGEPLDPKKKESTFKDFVEVWFESYVKINNKYSEIIGKEKTLRAHLVPYFGRRKLKEITNLDIEKYKADKLASGLAAKTVNNHLGVLHKAFQSAQEWDEANTCPIIKRLRIPPQKYDFLTLAECKMLLSAATGVWRDMLIVALGAGLRFGELIALSWEDIDFTTGDLTIKQAYAMGVLGSTKSNRIRHIPMTRSVRERLYAIRKKEGLVFSSQAGKPFKHNYCRKRLHSICKSAGLRKIGWHALRHTFASHLAQAGANLSAIQGLLGHSDIRTTMRYAHINRTVLQEAISVLDQFAGESRTACHNSVTGPAFATETRKRVRQGKDRNLAWNKGKENQRQLP